jgi:flavodoxin
VKSIVIYGTRYGNTHEVAKAIAISLEKRGSIQLFPAETTPSFQDADLVLLGGPTEGHGMSEPLKQFFARLETDSMRGKLIACFDTRLTWPRWLSGSAADQIADRARELGAEIIGPAGSFVVKGKTPELEPSELDRATAWADSVAQTAAARLTAARPTT